MVRRNLLAQIMQSARFDKHYQECLKLVEQRETELLALRDSLPEDQRRILEDYISACEEMDHALLSVVAKMTRRQLCEEICTTLEMEAFYKGAKQKLLERRGMPLETTPEYLQMCRDYNKTARRIMEDTGEEIPLVDLDAL